MAHQINAKKDAAVVIGGVNMDIWGRPTGALVMHDSCPGSVRMTPGGVARNIAHNLRLLGTDVTFISAVGDDLLGQALMESCRDLGFHMEHTLVKPGGRSSTYLFLTEAGGDMCAAVNDMDICAALTPDYFESLLPKLKGHSAMVLDANLPAESLGWLCSRSRMPVYVDTVSAAKAGRLLPHLKRLRALKTNAIEAAALTGQKDPECAAEKLAKLCPGRVFVSLGADGMIAAEHGKLHYLPAYETEVINSTGAGDAAAAAIIWADQRGFDLVSCAQLAQLAGSITCRSDRANNPELSTLPQMM